MTLLLSMAGVRMMCIDIVAGIKAVEVEELGMCQEVEVAFAEVDVAITGQLGHGWKSVEIVQVLRHIGSATPMICGRHPV